jgi:hypothetical protein
MKFAPGVPTHGDLPVDNFPWMKAIRDGLVDLWQATEQPSAESAVFITNFAFYYGDDDEPSPVGMGSFFPSLNPRVPIVDEPMIQDLLHCVQLYAEFPGKSDKRDGDSIWKPHASPERTRGPSIISRSGDI